MPGRYPDPPSEVTQAWASALIRALEDRDRQVSPKLPTNIARFTLATLVDLKMKSSERAVVWCDDAPGGAQLMVWSGSDWVVVNA